MLKRALIFIHRWLGVALSLVFLLWFASGIVMMYWTFPEVTEGDRLRRAPVLRATDIRVSPLEALAALGGDQPLEEVRLSTFDGRPVYRFGAEAGRQAGAMVYADDGTMHRGADEAMIDRAAAAWIGRPVVEAVKQSMDDVDQWTVGALRNVRPLYKYTWPDGQQVYVNGNTGQVVQYTTRQSRLWAYLGPIPHWLYFTPLRKHESEWFAVVVWSSLIGTIGALIGIVIVLWMYSPRKRYRYAGRPTSIPYRGWKRWHAIAGLFFGVITVTWTFSGLLSMGPFPIVDRLTALTVPSETAPEPDFATALRGSPIRLSSYTATPPAAAVASIPGFDVRELEFTTFDHAPVYIARNGAGDTRIVPVRGEPTASFDAGVVLRLVRQAAGSNLGELGMMDEYDAYYLDRHGERPLPVVYARLNDRVGTRYYIDPKTARVVGAYSARNWVSRWLYHGLHSLDFPWLYKYRPLWDIVVITLMLGGTALCMTSVVLAWRVMSRKLSALLRARLDEPDEDLPIDEP